MCQIALIKHYHVPINAEVIAHFDLSRLHNKLQLSSHFRNIFSSSRKMFTVHLLLFHRWRFKESKTKAAQAGQVLEAKVKF